MAKIYACFNNSVQADRAVGALLDHGFRSGELSLVICGSETDFHNWQQNNSPFMAGGSLSEEEFKDDVARGLCEEQRLEEPAPSPEEESHVRAAELIASDYVDRRVEMDRQLEEILGEDAPSKSGLSTTTGADTEVGAVRGTGIGLGVGLAAAAASIFIPGFGFVVGGSALATAIGGAAATTGAGAIVGAVTGYLRDQGADGDTIAHSEKALGSKGAVLEIDMSREVLDSKRVHDLLVKYGASAIGSGSKRYMG